MIQIQRIFERLARDLDEMAVEWAVIGGLAVSARAEPRSTRDIDIVVMVEDDGRAEQISSLLAARGYRIDSVLEHKDLPP